MLGTHRALLVGGLLLSAGVACVQANVGVYYINTYVDSRWLETTASVQTTHQGAAYGDLYGSTSSPTYLAGTWAFDETSSSAATPQTVVGTGGYATSDSYLDLGVSPTGFTLHGGGDVTAFRGADATAQSISADLVSYTQFNFRIPANDVAHEMHITGFADAASRSGLFFRIAEMPDDLSSTSNLVYINRTSSNSIAYHSEWDDEVFTLSPGHIYVVDFYADPAATVTAASSGPFTRHSELNITATFVPIPEPGVAAILLGSSALLLRREPRRRVEQVKA